MTRWSEYAELAFIGIVAVSEWGVARGIAVAFAVHLLAPPAQRGR